MHQLRPPAPAFLFSPEAGLTIVPPRMVVVYACVQTTEELWMTALTHPLHTTYPPAHLA